MFANDFDAQQPGDTLTVGNSGVSGDPFTGVAANLTFQADAAALGTALGLQIPSSYFRTTFANPTKYCRARYYFSTTAVAPSDLNLLRFYSGGNVKRECGVHINGANKLRLSNAVGTSGVWTATDALVPNQRYCLDLVAWTGTDPTDGYLTIAYWLEGEGLPIQEHTIPNTDVGSGSLLDTIQWGRGSDSLSSILLKVDQCVWDNTEGIVDVIGPEVPPVAPPTFVSTETPGICIIDARASTAGDGTGLTYSITPSVGVTEPVEGLFLVPQGEADADYTVNVTQSGTAYPHVVTVPALPTGGGAGGWRRIFSAGAWS